MKNEPENFKVSRWTIGAYFLLDIENGKTNYRDILGKGLLYAHHWIISLILAITRICIN